MGGLSEGERRKQVRNFLIEFKELMGQGRYYVMDHEKNIRTLIELGMTVRQREELLISLSLEDYSQGPFGMNINQIICGYLVNMLKELKSTSS